MQLLFQLIFQFSDTGASRRHPRSQRLGFAGDALQRPQCGLRDSGQPHPGPLPLCREFLLAPGQHIIPDESAVGKSVQDVFPQRIGIDEAMQLQDCLVHHPALSPQVFFQLLHLFPELVAQQLAHASPHACLRRIRRVEQVDGHLALAQRQRRIADQLPAASHEWDFFREIAKIPAFYLVALDGKALSRVRPGECQLRCLAEPRPELR